MWLDLHIASSKQMTEDSVDMRINCLLLMRYFSLHYFVVENGYFSLKKKKKTYVKHWSPQPDGDLIPQVTVFVVLLWREAECATGT